MKVTLVVCFVLALTACVGESDERDVNEPPTLEPQIDQESSPQSEDPQMVWPQIESVEPAPAIVGEKVIVVGRGGYLEIETEAATGYDESYRVFSLLLDDVEIGEIGCFVNRCEGEVTIPHDLSPGEYELFVEGGSSFIIEIAEK